MTPCKFQTDASGTQVLVYDRQRKLWAVATGRKADAICRALSLPQKLGKVYAMASQQVDGKIVIGERLPDQDW